jgi:chromosome segregation ATPase
MSDPVAIEEATRRLQEALDSLEAALERRTEADRSQAAMAAQVHAFESDRARLAAELDDLAARSRQLESTNRDVAACLDEAIDGIRAVIAAHDR